MADNKDDEEDTSSWKPPKRQLRPDGRMTGDLPVAPDPRPVTPSGESKRVGLPSLEALTTSELELDTARPGSRPAYSEPGPYREAVIPSRKSPLKWILLLVGLGLAAVAAFLLFPNLQRELELPVGKKGNLVIYSEPSGATVKIAGNVVGETPWAGDNLWGGEVKYEVSLPGHKSKWGTFKGGAEVKLNLTLPKK